MMVMSGSQPMTYVLCQVVLYSLLKENVEHTKRKVYSKTKGVFSLIFEDVMDDLTSFDVSSHKLIHGTN
jgi:hypothetical protein